MVEPIFRRWWNGCENLRYPNLIYQFLRVANTLTPIDILKCLPMIVLVLGTACMRHMSTYARLILPICHSRPITFVGLDASRRNSRAEGRDKFLSHWILWESSFRHQMWTLLNLNLKNLTSGFQQTVRAHSKSTIRRTISFWQGWVSTSLMLFVGPSPWREPLEMICYYPTTGDLCLPYAVSLEGKVVRPRFILLLLLIRDFCGHAGSGWVHNDTKVEWVSLFYPYVLVQYWWTWFTRVRRVSALC